MKPQPPRTPSRLSESVHHQLNMYALAASAAGVAVLALAQPAEAKIVYTRIHQVIGTKGHYDLDLNHDGTTDFVLLQTGNPTWNGTRASNTLIAEPLAANVVEGCKYAKYYFGGGNGLASALNAGARIGSGAPFRKKNVNRMMAATWQNDCNGGPSGLWLDVTNRYLGLKFQIHGKTHYAWARMTVQLRSNFLLNATLTGYAYETIPGKPIITGKTKGPDVITVQPASLGRLAQGSAGLAAWRSGE